MIDYDHDYDYDDYHGDYDYDQLVQVWQVQICLQEKIIMMIMIDYRLSWR